MFSSFFNFHSHHFSHQILSFFLDQDLLKAFVVSHKLGIIFLSHQNLLDFTHLVIVSCVLLEKKGDLPAALFNHICWNSWHQGSWSAVSWVELRDKQNRELVFADNVQRLLEILVRFSRESTYNVGGDGDTRYAFAKELHHMREILGCVFSPHVIQDLVTSCLNRDMQEREHTRVVQDLGHFLQVFQDVGRVCHA
eukprot:Lithocolla_globosa_v1_NODE_3291_length_1710_cov_4.891239.p2 type:complete len:195 gc:universal NODE_3291_length_1710_cov_4.891239:263-847(+)